MSLVTYGKSWSLPMWSEAVSQEDIIREQQD